MKANRILIIAVLALLVLGAFAVAGSHWLPRTAAAQGQPTPPPPAAVSGQDGDNVDEQVGDQNAPDNGPGIGAASDEEDATLTGTLAITDTDNVEVQEGDQNGPDDGEVREADGEHGILSGTLAITDTDNVEVQEGDQNGPDNGAEVREAGAGQDAAPAGTPLITADTARQTAEAYLNAGPATQVELDDENGKLVYSVEIGTTDVKVDAMTGAVLGTDTGQD
jgi:uncharacterized membrane protein YkoI